MEYGEIIKSVWLCCIGNLTGNITYMLISDSTTLPYHLVTLTSYGSLPYMRY